MRILLAGLIVAGLIPLAFALRAHRGTSLFHALAWGVVAWLSWGIAFLVGDVERGGMEPSRYCALCLTGCAGVAVLGARRPHVGAWNFVVLGLLGVMVLPLLETLLIGTHPVDGLRIFFLASIIAVGILNYLPTRLAPAAFLLMLCTAAEIVLLYAPVWLSDFGAAWIVHLLLTAVPWIGWVCWTSRGADHSEFDRLWLQFRDSWGLVWSQRVREQFNHAAENAGWPARLYWQGLVIREKDAILTVADRQKMLETLRGVLQRFIASHDSAE